VPVSSNAMAAKRIRAVMFSRVSRGFNANRDASLLYRATLPSGVR
jgi:hypothetical protein